MNEELSENVVLGDNAEEKNREVYMPPRLNKLENKRTEHGGAVGGLDGPFAS